MSNSVLVVDDDPVSIHLLEIILQRSGYRVLSALTGRSGLELVMSKHPDVVIIDDMLPGMTGGEMCRQIKDAPELQHIPVILISAGMRVQDRSYIKKVGADYALAKPILPRDVIEAIENALTRT